MCSSPEASVLAGGDGGGLLTIVNLPNTDFMAIEKGSFPIIMGFARLLSIAGVQVFK